MTTDPHDILSEAARLATGSAVLLDRVSLRDHVVTLDIGAFAEERGAPQRISFTVVVDVLPTQAPLADDVDRILSYDLIVEAIEAETSSGRINLLETLAEGIAARILDHYQVARVMVRVEKLDRVSGCLGVEIARSGIGADPSMSPRAVTRPAVYCLPESAHHQAWFDGWLMGVLASTTPALLVIEGRAPERLAASAPLAQRRVDLLAAEQAAWSLAAEAPECIVTATRTEFEHAFKSGRPTVWAPSKMVFDAAGGVNSVPADFAEMCAWFAHDIDAANLTFVHRPVPTALWDFSGPVSGQAPG